MAHASRRPFAPFDLTAADFRGFRPRIEGRQSRMVPVSTNDPAEPNIVAIETTDGRHSELVRLVHGYNMPTCLQIKGYEVVLAGDWRDDLARHAVRYPIQVWRVKAPDGAISMWATTLLKAGDFSALDADIRSMAFPRVDSPDDPNWVPQGVTRTSLRHPIASLRGWFRARWNSSRTDWLTFLRLRQPAWASEERLSFVVRSLQPDVTPANQVDVVRTVVAVHHGALASFQQWRKATPR